MHLPGARQLDLNWPEVFFRCCIERMFVFFYRQVLYRKWQQLGLPCRKIEVVTWVGKLMALLSSQSSRFFTSWARKYWKLMFLMPWKRTVHVFWGNQFKQCIERNYFFKLRSTRLIRKSMVCIIFSANKLAWNVTIPNFLLFNVKRVGKIFQLESKQFRVGM